MIQITGVENQPLTVFPLNSTLVSLQSLLSSDASVMDLVCSSLYVTALHGLIQWLSFVLRIKALILCML